MFAFCLPISSVKGKQASKTCGETRAHTQQAVLLSSTRQTQTVKSMKDHQLISEQDLAAQSYERAEEEVICGRSVSDFIEEEPSSEKRWPSFNTAAKPKQKPHQFSLITTQGALIHNLFITGVNLLLRAGTPLRCC